ncbi:MAG: leucine-rich repeat protein [Prevotella sp.]|nr:leucine-rich repeat protein [Prevotella sp.]
MNKQYLLFMLALLFAQGLYATPFEADEIWYELTSDTTVKVVEEPTSTGSGTSFTFRKCYEGDIVIPMTVFNGENTYTVTAVENGTFRESAKLTSISLPATLTDLGTAPFADCPSLTSIAVDAENPAYTIVEGLLYDKDVTTLIATPGTVAGDVTLPATVTVIAPSAFQGCAYITAINIPETVGDIGKHAFHGCSQLSAIDLPEGITAINDSVFYYCLALSEIDIPSSVTSVGVKAFYHCNKLTRVTLPDAVETLADYAFSLCYGITEITLSENLKTIGYRAFENCSKIKKITIPAHVSEIARLPFCGCSSLTTITVAEENTTFSSLDGVLYDKDQQTLLCYPSAKLSDFVMPSTVTTIGEYGFYSARLLKSLVLPTSVTTISDGAFRLCSGLKTIIMPASVTTLGSNLFVACSALEAIVYYAVEPPAISETTFTETNLSVPLYVLARVVDDYKNAEHWSGFTTILPIDESVVSGLLGDTNDDTFINMTDVTQVINYILGREVTDFKWQRADLNFDGFINMTDVTMMINIILNKE